MFYKGGAHMQQKTAWQQRTGATRHPSFFFSNVFISSCFIVNERGGGCLNTKLEQARCVFIKDRRSDVTILVLGEKSRSVLLLRRVLQHYHIQK